MKYPTISLTILFLMIVCMGMGFSADRQDLTKHVTNYPKGHQARAEYFPERVVHYNKQHFAFTDAQDMYPKQTKKKGK